MNENRRLAINFITTAIAFIINAGINFILSSYIVNTVSAEAYGFIQLANNFVTYFTVITLAINSMASRYISIEYYKNNINNANEYYSSTFFANLLITIIFLPIIVILILFLDKIITISSELIVDVKFLLIFLIGNMFLGLLTTNLSVSYYIKNKLYIQSIINSIGYVLKAVLLLVLYMMFPPYVAIFGLVTLIITIFTQSLTIYYKNKLIPNIKIHKNMFSFQRIKTIIVSGIWNSITRIGNIMSEGLDLLLANLFISSENMGILAIVKTIPNLIGNALSTLVNIFMPTMIKLYAEEKMNDFVLYTKKSMKIVSFFLNIPILCLIVLGDVLFKLWFPEQESIVLQILSIITISHWIIIGPVSIMHNIFTVINKIKINSILVCITGILNVILVYIFLKFTNLGLFAITGVSCLLSILRNLLYVLPYSAKYLNLRWYTFLPELLRSLIAVIIITGIGYIGRIFCVPSTWIQLIISGCILCFITFIVQFGLLFNKEEKTSFIVLLKRFIK